METLKKMHLKACAVNLADNMALLVFIMNIIWSGSGTILAGILAGGETTKNNIIVGLI